MNRFFRPLALCLSSVVLFFISNHFWWPAVFVSLVPMAVLFCRAKRWWEAALWAAVGTVMIMFPVQFPLWAYNQAGVFLLSCYQAVSVVLMALGVRAVWRKWDVSLVWIWPVAVVAGEYLRMLGMLGVPLGSLAGSCRDQTWMLQVCDLGGIYTLSFPIAMVQGWVADRILKRPFAKKPLAVIGVAWVAVALYGYFRPAQIEAGMEPGPRIAVIQPDVVYVLNSRTSYDPDLLLAKLKELTERAAVEGDTPDLFVWPEGISSFPLHSRDIIQAPYDHRMRRSPAQWALEKKEMARFEQDFARWVAKLDAPLIVGMDSLSPAEAGHRNPFRHRNAAQIYDPVLGQTDSRQFKMRLYPGGEYFPWSGTWLNRTLAERGILPTVFGVDGRFEPGTKRETFRIGGEKYIISICSEIFSPVSSGIFLPSTDGEKPFGFQINIANEGTFLSNQAQIHQFSYFAYRAIEARVGIARSSNTGISAFISPTGKVYGQVTDAEGRARTGLGAPELGLIDSLMAYRKANEKDFATDAAKRAEVKRRILEIETLREKAGIEGFSVERVFVYPHRTVYQRLGDWLGISCLIGLVGMMILPLVSRSDGQLH